MAYRVKLKTGSEERDILTFFIEYFYINPMDKAAMPSQLLTFHKELGLISKDYQRKSDPLLKDYDRNCPHAFRAGGQPIGGLFHITVESTDDDDFLYDWMKGVRNGVLEFYDSSEEDLPFRRIEFWDAWVSELSEEMSAVGGAPMLMHCVISPATVRFNKSIVLQKCWFETDINAKYGGGEEYKPSKNIISVKWIDKDTNKEVKQTLSEEWVNLKIEIKNFEKGDEIKINIKEVNGKVLEGKKTEIELSKKAEGSEDLIINKAFRFSKETININREVKATVYWNDENKAEKNISTENNLKENNGGIWGVISADANKVMKDIKQVFSAPRFAAFNLLVLIDTKNNTRITNIDEDDLKKILENPLFNSDDKLAVEIVANTINSTKKHEVQIKKSSDTLSTEAENIIKSNPILTAIKDGVGKSGKVPTINVIGMYYGSVTMPTDKGSFSLVIEDSALPTDYYDNDKKKYVNIPSIIGHSIITLHEIVGHGRSLTLGRTERTNNDDAIYFENLLLRIMGYYNIQRDGTNHADFHKIDKPSTNPAFR
jgi:hypothetical protein